MRTKLLTLILLLLIQPFSIMTTRAQNDLMRFDHSLRHLFPYDVKSMPNLKHLDDESVQRVVSILRNNIKQWSFVESQLLEPNVNVAMPEIFIPLGHLTTTLEVLGNVLFMREQLTEARSCLERACPLMELLPSGFHEGRQYTAACFAVLREVYFKLRGGRSGHAQSSSLPLPIDPAPDEHNNGIILSTENIISDTNRNKAALYSDVSYGNSIYRRGRNDKTHVETTANANTQDTEDQEAAARIAELRAPYSHLRPEGSEGNSHTTATGIGDNRDRWTHSSESDSTKDSESTHSIGLVKGAFPRPPRPIRHSPPTDLSSQWFPPEIIQNFRESDSPSTLNDEESTIEDAHQAAADLLTVIETTTGITRDLEIMLRRFVLEDDSGRAEVLNQVRLYRDGLQQSLQAASQSVRVYFYDDLGLTEAYYECLQKATTSGLKWVTKELVRLKKLVLSGGFRFDASNTIDQGESLELVELDGGNSAAMENEADEDLHLASSEELELVQALTALPRADRNRLMVLHAVDKAVRADRSDYLEFAEQVRRHKQSVRLAIDGNVQHVADNQPDEYEDYGQPNIVESNEPISGSQFSASLYEEISKDLSPQVWISRRREQVKQQQLKHKQKLKSQSRSSSGSVEDGRSRISYADNHDSTLGAFSDDRFDSFREPRIFQESVGRGEGSALSIVVILALIIISTLVYLQQENSYRKSRGNRTFQTRRPTPEQIKQNIFGSILQHFPDESDGNSSNSRPANRIVRSNDKNDRNNETPLHRRDQSLPTNYWERQVNLLSDTIDRWSEISKGVVQGSAEHSADWFIAGCSHAYSDTLAWLYGEKSNTSVEINCSKPDMASNLSPCKPSSLSPPSTTSATTSTSTSNRKAPAVATRHEKSVESPAITAMPIATRSSNSGTQSVQPIPVQSSDAPALRKYRLKKVTGTAPTQTNLNVAAKLTTQKGVSTTVVYPTSTTKATSPLQLADSDDSKDSVGFESAVISSNSVATSNAPIPPPPANLSPTTAALLLSPEYFKLLIDDEMPKVEPEFVTINRRAKRREKEKLITPSTNTSAPHISTSISHAIPTVKVPNMKPTNLQAHVAELGIDNHLRKGQTDEVIQLLEMTKSVSSINKSSVLLAHKASTNDKPVWQLPPKQNTSDLSTTSMAQDSNSHLSNLSQISSNTTSGQSWTGLTTSRLQSRSNVQIQQEPHNTLIPPPLSANHLSVNSAPTNSAEPLDLADLDLTEISFGVGYGNYDDELAAPSTLQHQTNALTTDRIDLNSTTFDSTKSLQINSHSATSPTRPLTQPRTASSTTPGKPTSTSTILGLGGAQSIPYQRRTSVSSTQPQHISANNSITSRPTGTSRSPSNSQSLLPSLLEDNFSLMVDTRGSSLSAEAPSFNPQYTVPKYSQNHHHLQSPDSSVASLDHFQSQIYSSPPQLAGLPPFDPNSFLLPDMASNSDVYATSSSQDGFSLSLGSVLSVQPTHTSSDLSSFPHIIQHPIPFTSSPLDYSLHSATNASDDATFNLQYFGMSQPHLQLQLQHPIQSADMQNVHQLGDNFTQMLSYPSNFNALSPSEPPHGELTLLLSCVCSYQPADESTQNVKIVSDILGGWSLEAAVDLYRTNTDHWAIALQLPASQSLFEYRYVVERVNGEVFAEAGSRILALHSVEQTQEDVIEQVISLLTPSAIAQG